MNNQSISVVIPCFNEGRKISENIRLIFEYLKNNFSDFEIIAVNDGSLDDTQEKLLALKNSLPDLKIISYAQNSGKGEAVRRGVTQAEKDLIMFLDADLAIPIEELEKFIEEIENGSDIVIASRFVGGLQLLKPVLFHRRIMEKIFRYLRIFIIGLAKIRDTQCGFKVFKKEAAKNIFFRTTIRRFSFDAEVLFIAEKYDYHIKEMPVHLQNPTDSSVRLIFDPLNMLLDLFRIRINDLKGRYARRK